MANMRVVFLDIDAIYLTGTLVHSSGGESSTITIQINLGDTETPVTRLQVTFATITKNELADGRHKNNWLEINH